MDAGTEGHAGVEADEDLFTLGFVREPGRADNQSFAQVLDGVMVAPGKRPVLLSEQTGLKVSNRAEEAEKANDHLHVGRQLVPSVVVRSVGLDKESGVGP